MKLKLYKMESKKDKKTGLPNYFKKVGIGLILAIFLVGIVMKLIGYDYDEATRTIRRTISLDLIILGLLFIALAKDKVEDEMTVHLKLKSMASAFLFAIILTIIYPIIDLAFNDPIEEISSSQLIMTILIVQITSYYGFKRSEAK